MPAPFSRRPSRDEDSNGAPSERLRASGGDSARTRKPSILIVVFLVSLVLPIIFHVGSIRLSPYRLVLLAVFVQSFISWMSGGIGKIRSPDVLMLLFSLWGAFAFFVHYGIDGLQPSGILMLETFGTYLLARRLVNDPESFQFFVRSLVWIIVILLPFTIYETITGYNITLAMFDKFVETFPDVSKDRRWGLDRVQGPFEHPILFGVFCSAGFGLGFYVLKQGGNIFQKSMRTMPAFLGTFFSLSSGPLSALTAQMFVIGWDLATKRIQNRWMILFGAFVAAYVAIDALSNRAPFTVMLAYFAFNADTAYTRVYIWEFGTANVLRHPVFGLAFNAWEHGPGMTDSMDMFWLVNAVQFGLPAAIFFTLAVLIILFQLGRRKLTNAKIADYRTGLVITIVGLSLAGWTVHFWNATYVLFVFLVGSGVWMLNLREDDEQGNATAAEPADNHSAAWRRERPKRESAINGG